MAAKSSIQLIRNATIVFNYAGKKFLIDPMLAGKGTYPGFPGTVNAHLNNPLVDLPVNPISLFDADAVIVTHLHIDHWDEIAKETLPKDKPVFVQNEEDAQAISTAGFTNVRILSADTKYENVNFQKTACQHGSDEAYAIPQLAALLGKASGLLFNNKGEKSVYFVGDTIWIDQVESNLKKFNPDVVVLNAGLATGEKFGPVIMGKEDVLRVRQILPQATIIAIHMEALNHCLLTRKELREYVEEKGISDKVIIPEDGQLIQLTIDN